MKKASLLMLCIILFAAKGLAGEIFGTLAEGDKPLPSGVKVEIVAGGKSYAAETDKFGGYRLFVKEKGKCQLKVHYKDQVATTDIFSFDKSTRYDWVLEVKDGKYSLRRK